jgi:DNA topoisomerase-3
MRLFIAEKPSMARELAKCLPAPQQRGNGFIKTGGGIVTWAYGHVLQQAEPQDYDPKYKIWKAEDLPIVPQTWKLLISPNSKDQFQLICQLVEEADTIVNAGDPDREGQLLIDEILDYVGNKKPVQRVLLNALDEKSIHESLEALQDNHDFLHLKESALARSRADWLIGMNLSRAYTLAARRQGHRGVFPIGRVKTPTLALVVRRQRELDDFQPVTYYVVKADFIHKNGVVTAQWQPKDTQSGLDSEGRCVEETVAKSILESLAARPAGVISENKKTKKKESQRLPLSLSTLQVLAGKRYGYSPQQVLDTAQQLYERKLTTYPRSDCEYLPVNQRKDIPAILANLGRIQTGNLSEWVRGADSKIKSRAWNDSKITAHHAIIPTTVACPFSKLNSMQQHIYYLIARAYVTQFYPIHEYDQTRIVIEAADEQFLAHGKTITVMGWKELYRSDKSEEEDTKGDLPAVRKGDSVQYKQGQVEKKATKPPPKFTASTLLAAMKEIYKYVKDDSLKKKLKEVQGIGTEATRATIIGELIQRKFLVEEGKKKYLKPTDNAYLLIDALPDNMVYPDETAIWEERLYQMSNGKDDLQSFLQDQIAFLKKLVQAATEVTIQHTDTTGKVCPECGSVMVLRHGKYGDFYGCSNYPTCRHTEPAVSAEPIEKKDQQYPCPRCKKGWFVKRNSKYGPFWVCSEAGCHTKCADVNGLPSIYANKK